MTIEELKISWDIMLDDESKLYKGFFFLTKNYYFALVSK